MGSDGIEKIIFKLSNFQRECFLRAMEMLFSIQERIWYGEVLVQELPKKLIIFW